MDAALTFPFMGSTRTARFWLRGNDARDAEAICETVTRPSMRFVVVESFVRKVCQFVAS